jgi:hypothetical protein
MELLEQESELPPPVWAVAVQQLVGPFWVISDMLAVVVVACWHWSFSAFAAFCSFG